jgi:hypothetical protein
MPRQGFLFLFFYSSFNKKASYECISLLVIFEIMHADGKQEEGDESNY